jgi:hypothetical protein
VGRALRPGERRQDQHARRRARVPRRLAQVPGLLGQHPDQAELDQATEKLIRAEAARQRLRLAQQAPLDRPGRPLSSCAGTSTRSWPSTRWAATTRRGRRSTTCCPRRASCAGPTTSCIPTSAEKRYGAHLFIDYVTRPEVSGKNASWIWCSSPVDGSEEFTDEFALSVRPSEEELAAFGGVPRPGRVLAHVPGGLDQGQDRLTPAARPGRQGESVPSARTTPPHRAYRRACFVMVL